MKYLDQNYTFDASAKTITFDSWSAIDLEQILLITNMKRRALIFDFSNPDLGGDVSTNVLTLDYDTTSHADTDTLQIWLLADLETQVDETTNATYTYVGAAVPGTLGSAAYWQIYRFETSGDLHREYADNNRRFDNVWDNRDSLSY